MKRFFWLLAIFLFTVSFFCFYEGGPLAHVLYYHEQHHLFLFSKEYFLHQLHTEGITGYLACFLIQFFHWPLLGSILISLLLVSIYLLSHYCFQRITHQADFLQLSLLPSIYILVQFTAVEFPVSTLVAWLLGLLLLAGVTTFPLPLWRAFAWIPNANRLSLKLKYSILFIVLIAYASGGFYLFVHSYNMGERIMVMSDKYVKERNWEQVLSLTHKYLRNRGSNQLIAYFHNLALYHTGQLAEHLLDTPQRLGVQSLYFPWQSDSRQSEYGHYLYEDLGSINEAQRWEFEAMVVWGETVSHLRNLIRYNIVNHRPKVAQRFINVLKQTLFYRKEALAFEAIVSTGIVPGLKAIPHSEQEPIRFANVLNIGPDLQYICDRDSTNRMAFEYLMSDLLLSNHLVRFAQNLPRIHSFSYAQMPRIYEEALYIYQMGTDEEAFNKVGFTVGPETKQRFQRYYTLYKQSNNAALEAEFGNTYWYYLHFISPYGNKINQE